MFVNIKFRWFVPPFLLAALFLIAVSPVMSWAEALEDAQERVRQNPNDAEGYNNLGYAYEKRGRHQDAIASYKEALRIKPDGAEGYNNLGYAHERLGRHQDAIRSYNQAIRIAPDYALAHNNLGYTYEKLGRYQQAIAKYEEALKIDPGLAMARKNLNRIRGKTAQARPSRPLKTPASYYWNDGKMKQSPHHDSGKSGA